MRTIAILIAIASVTFLVPVGAAASEETNASSNSTSGSICATSISNTIQCAQMSIESTTQCYYDWYDRWYCYTSFTITVNAQGVAFCADGNLYGTGASASACPFIGVAAPATGGGGYFDYVSAGGETKNFLAEICIENAVQQSCKAWIHSVYEPGPPTSVPNAGAIVTFAVNTAVSALAALPT